MQSRKSWERVFEFHKIRSGAFRFCFREKFEERFERHAPRRLLAP